MIYMLNIPIIPEQGIYVHQRLDEMRLRHIVMEAQEAGEFRNFITNEQYCRGISSILGTQVAPPLKTANGEPVEQMPEIELEDGDILIILSIQELPPSEEYPRGSAHIQAVGLTHFNDSSEGIGALLAHHADKVNEAIKTGQELLENRDNMEGGFAKQDRSIEAGICKNVFIYGTQIPVFAEDVKTPPDLHNYAYSDPICRALRRMFPGFAKNIYQIRADRCAVHFIYGGYNKDRPLPNATLHYSKPLAEWLDAWHESFVDADGHLKATASEIALKYKETTAWDTVMMLVITEIDREDDRRRWQIDILQETEDGSRNEV